MRALLALTVALGACAERGLAPEEPCTRVMAGRRMSLVAVDHVDLLLVIDNSHSTFAAQEALVAEVPRLVRVLGTGDLDEDGVIESTPVRSLQVGVVTSDMGSGGHPVPGCDHGMFGARFGDDGVLITRGRTATDGCMATYPRFFEHVPSLSDGEDLAADVSCVALAGVTGCGFEQHLEAALKALSPASATSWTVPGYVAPVFAESTYGHGDSENAGFVRDGSVLAVLILGDEDDASVRDPEIFDVADGDLQLSAFRHPEALHPIARYVRGETGRAGLLGIRSPRALVFGAIVGIPPEAEGRTCDEILALRELTPELDPDAPPSSPRLRPSCNAPSGVAFPPRRIVEVACALEDEGAHVTVGSSCQASFAAPIDAFAARIARALDRSCLAPLPLRPDGLADCSVYEVQPAGADVDCEARAARVGAGEVTVGGEVRRVCEIVQVDPESGEPGWWLERAEATPAGSDVRAICGDDGERIRIHGGRPAGTELRLECLESEGACR